MHCVHCSCKLSPLQNRNEPISPSCASICISLLTRQCNMRPTVEMKGLLSAYPVTVPFYMSAIVSAHFNSNPRHKKYKNICSTLRYWFSKIVVKSCLLHHFFKSVHEGSLDRHGTRENALQYCGSLLAIFSETTITLSYSSIQLRNSWDVLPSPFPVL